MSARLEGEFVVFLIGMRVNRPWKIHKWLPVAAAMPRMLAELASQRDSGFLAHEIWLGRTIVVLQYWRSSEQLFAYAKDRNAKHLPAWRAFNKAIGTSGDVGIWHETYVVAPGAFESVYVNMPPFGLGKAGSLTPASGKRETAAGRLRPRDATA
ncbi:MAG: DUF4188 domain-containing protein [Candidatus Eremiobacteraeota bacterium]|nr:DUF4188 domain-containing protein [Candidatus Eremiobacteraeota bacterium]